MFSWRTCGVKLRIWPQACVGHSLGWHVQSRTVPHDSFLASKPAHGIIPWASWLHFFSKLANEQVTSECIPHASSRARTVCTLSFWWYSNQFGLPLGMSQLGLHMMHLFCSIRNDGILSSKQPLNLSCFRSKLPRIRRCWKTRDSWAIFVDLLVSNDVDTVEWLASCRSTPACFAIFKAGCPWWLVYQMLRRTWITVLFRRLCASCAFPKTCKERQQEPSRESLSHSKYYPVFCLKK